MKKIAVLISGRGSNLQAIIKAKEQNIIRSDIHLVISNNPTATGLEYAQQADITSLAIDPKAYRTNKHYEQAILVQLKIAQIDYIVLAGYMKLLGETLLNAYKGKIINIHPSLLPKHKGLDAQKKALDSADTESGCSIHYVTAKMDDGPIIAQARVPILKNDTISSLSDRILKEEHRLYPITIQAVMEGKYSEIENKLIGEVHE